MTYKYILCSVLTSIYKLPHYAYANVPKSYIQNMSQGFWAKDFHPALPPPFHGLRYV